MECTSDEVNINNELITIDTKIHDPKKSQSVNGITARLTE